MRTRFAMLVCALALSGALAACEDDKPTAAPVNSRVNAAAAPVNPHAVEAFCDKRFASGASERRGATGPYASMPPSTQWRWVNVWATWCRPCVEEMPLIKQWIAHGLGMALQFVSVDESDAVVAGYAAQHPEAQGSVRLSSPAELPALIQALGLDSGATIPIHAFYDPSGQLRCVRTGAVHEGDLDILRRMMRGE